MFTFGTYLDLAFMLIYTDYLILFMYLHLHKKMHNANNKIKKQFIKGEAAISSQNLYC